MKFSPSKLAYYNPRLEKAYKEKGDWPDDLIDLTDEEIITYCKKHTPREKQLGITEGGRPCHVDIAPPTKDERAAIETNWRDIELTKVLNRIDQYEKDQNYPVELRTSPIKNDEGLLKLLEDRKVLSDYPEHENFPFGDRPQLSGLAN